MIIDWLLDAGFASVVWLVGLLPTVDFDVGVFSGVASHIAWVGCYVDLGLWGVVFGLIAGTEFSIWMVQAVVWLWERLPFT